MFFLHEQEATLSIHPSFFGPHVNHYIERQLIKDKEGYFNGRFFTVCILSAYEITEGRVQPGTGMAEYQVHYKAVVWKPFKGEVLDGLVETVTETGFFVDVGPLSVFISQQMIPKEIKYDGNATPAQWTDNGDQVIEKGTQVRLKVKGTRGEADRMFAIATIKEATSINLNNIHTAQLNHLYQALNEASVGFEVTESMTSQMNFSRPARMRPQRVY